MAKARGKHQRQQRTLPASQQPGVVSSKEHAKAARHERWIVEAHSLAEAGRLDEALKLCSDTLNEDPEKPEALFIAGYVLLKAERFGLAYWLMKACVQLVPEREQAWNNLGLIAASLHRHVEARQHLNKSLTIKPNQTESKNNVALIYVNESNPEKAIEWADKSLAMNPVQPDVQETRGYACLMLHRWAEGWDGYEAAVGNSKYRKPKPMKGEPYWDGTEGKRIYIRGEQGIGDEILFASCLHDVIKNSHVAFECDRRLEGLFRRSFPEIPVFGTRHEQRTWSGDFDYHALIGTLHKYYRRTPEAFPGTPYLKPDPERVVQWKALLDRLPGKKIGLAWTGGIRNTFTERRSLAVEQLAPILRVPGCTFVSLEYKQPELSHIPYKIHHWARGSEAKDLDDVAALIESLDLVICVTTAAAHLAGAIGKECWILVNDKPHWHYGLTGDRMPWYNSVKLYRENGDWERCITKVGDDLAARVGASGDGSGGGMLDLDGLRNSEGVRESPGKQENLPSAPSVVAGSKWSDPAGFVLAPPVRHTELHKSIASISGDKLRQY